MTVCNICSCDFDPEAEGGMVGHIGILPMALCPNCWAGVRDAVEQYSPCIHGPLCPTCEEERE